jgi:hypothetical protein
MSWFLVMQQAALIEWSDSASRGAGGTAGFLRRFLFRRASARTGAQRVYWEVPIRPWSPNMNTIALWKAERTGWPESGVLVGARLMKATWMQRQIVGAVLLTVVLGVVAAAILGIGPGMVCALLIFIALVVAKNL